MGGGGLSTVKLCKYSRLSPSNSDLRTEYVIQGERIADKSVSTYFLALEAML